MATPLSMARKPEFKYSQVGNRWKVEVPASHSATGKRTRAFFPTRDKARDFASDLKTRAQQVGAMASAIKPSLAEDATQAVAMLEPYGLTLLEAVKMVVAIEDGKRRSMEVTKAATLFLATKDDRSDSQVRAYEQMRKSLEADFKDRMLSTITAQELVEHVERHTGANSTFNSRATSIKTFWRWCAKIPRGWCDSKTVEALERRETRQGEIGVLTAQQCRVLLRTAETFYPECVPGFAISLFAGLRNTELERLDPSDINEEGITLRAEATKTRKRRFIEMPPVLSTWLAAYPIGDTVLPANWFRKEKAVRRRAGWNVWCDLFDPPQAPDGSPDWPGNALRHTHASVMVALGEPLERLTFEFGHSGGAAVLKSHYVGAMTPDEARRIREIGPNGSTVPIGRKTNPKTGGSNAKSHPKTRSRKKPKRTG
ncbi:MAG: hypothetical protein J0M04_08450 [Verrucomicrobia bacterium]|nr:hypothetical protein [Verrucomicrobiota bacterium]